HSRQKTVAECCRSTRSLPLPVLIIEWSSECKSGARIEFPQRGQCRNQKKKDTIYEIARNDTNAISCCFVSFSGSLFTPKSRSKTRSCQFAPQGVGRVLSLSFDCHYLSDTIHPIDNE